MEELHINYKAFDRILSVLSNSTDIIEKQNSYLDLEFLMRIWTPNLVESSWDPDFYYGNELEEDHSDKPMDVQNVYEKIKLCRSLFCQ